MILGTCVARKVHCHAIINNCIQQTATSKVPAYTLPCHCGVVCMLCMHVSLLTVIHCLPPRQAIDGINLFGLISIVSLFICAPAAYFMEGSQWAVAWQAATARVGEKKLWQMLAAGGLFYHLYNQVSQLHQ